MAVGDGDVAVYELVADVGAEGDDAVGGVAEVMVELVQLGVDLVDEGLTVGVADAGIGYP